MLQECDWYRLGVHSGDQLQQLRLGHEPEHHRGHRPLQIRPHFLSVLLHGQNKQVLPSVGDGSADRR